MRKIFDYIKAHPCITIIHTLGALMVLMCFFFESWAATGALNFISLFSESGSRNRNRVALPLLGFGAYSASKSNMINRERERAEFTKFIEGFFFVLLWTFVYYLVSWLLYRFGYYNYSRIIW